MRDPSDSGNMPLQGRNFLREQLREIPAFRALIRALESRLLCELDSLPRPILDIGCGDGQFAQSTFRAPLDAGIDLDAGMLRHAQRRKAYHIIARASAIALPFGNASFGSAIANCSLEHIPDLQAALGEISRVLRPGGLFALTVPSHAFGGLLLGSTLLGNAGLERAAEWYARWFNGHAQHFHLYSPQKWVDQLEALGLAVQHWEYYLSPAATRAFDMAHYLSVPSLITYRAFGKWVLWPDFFTRHLFEKWMGPFAAERLGTEKTGACIFLLARKSES